MNRRQIRNLAGEGRCRYEHILNSHSESTGGLSGLMAEAAKQVRRHVNTANGHDSGLRDIAAGVIAPLQFSYVLWILRKARSRALSRVYFLSRDGQALLRIARQLSGPYGVDCELRYLYASRQTFNRTVPGQNPYGSWLWTNINERTTTLELLDRIGITPEEIQGQLERSGLDKKTWSESITGSRQLKLRSVLHEKAVQTLVRTRSQEKKELLLRYLEQEKVLDGSSNACVDIGWKGSAHSTLSSLLNDATGNSIHGLHFGLTTGQSTWEETREAYFFDLGRKTGYRDLTPMAWAPGDRMMILIEAFCMATHGTVSDFVDNEGAIKPVLRDAWEPIITDWGLPIVRRSVDVFTEYMGLRLGDTDVNADVRAPIAEILTEFWSNPTTTEASAWGSFPVEAGQGQEPHLSAMAAPFDWSYPFRVLFPSIARPSMDHHWRAGSLRLSWPLTGAVMRLLFHLRDWIKPRQKSKQEA